jgi:hypothetical protein
MVKAKVSLGLSNMPQNESQIAGDEVVLLITSHINRRVICHKLSQFHPCKMSFWYSADRRMDDKQCTVKVKIKLSYA